MIDLDMRTVVLSNAISNLICLMVITAIWKRGRNRYRGIGLWVADYILQFAALILIVVRGSIPDLLSMTGSNVMVLSGTLLLLYGLERFASVRSSHRIEWIALAVFTIAHWYFVAIDPSLVARNILFSVGLLLVSLRCALFSFRGMPERLKPAARQIGLVFLYFGTVCVIRIVTASVLPTGADLFKAPAHETAAMLAFQMLFIILTFSLSLFVNKCLLDDLELDITARRDVEAALRLSEEKFSKAFMSSPDAIIVTRMTDGRFIEVNEGFTQITGYAREDILIATTSVVDLWTDPADRDRCMDIIRAGGIVRDAEFRFRGKDGRTFFGSYSGAPFRFGVEACILSVVRDIGDRRRADAIIKLRLSLWEFAGTHSPKEIMRRALDNIEALTDSSIGFYHFVDETSGEVLLQTWSTQTLSGYCTASGEDRHYPVDQAGIWADCVRERRSIIHNDYNRAAGRRGLPNGHAALFRELVVPTFRDGRIVAILGVGNKAAPYDEDDIDLVAYIADLVWTIIERRQSEDRIIELNDKLRVLAMTDELTGLANRRSFFQRGEEETRKARRYRQSLAMIMLDVDKFKNVNDGYGHDVGDEVLKSITHAIRAHCREVDLTARLGGEEFGILLPQSNAEAATIVAERLRETIEKSVYEKAGQTIRVTASLGVAIYDETMSGLDTLIVKADEAMYLAKKDGRNRVATAIIQSDKK